MCLGAIYWARPAAVYFAAGREQAAAAGFDDAFIYQQIERDAAQRSIPFCRLALSRAEEPFEQWRLNRQRIDY